MGGRYVTVSFKFIWYIKDVKVQRLYTFVIFLTKETLKWKMLSYCILQLIQERKERKKNQAMNIGLHVLF